MRTEPSDPATQTFFGFGFGSDCLSARFAAEGEAIERATWRMGALWNDAGFAEAGAILPEESRLTLRPALVERLLVEACTAVEAFDGQSSLPEWVPIEAVFAQPLLGQDRKRHSVTTGWAFHASRQAAARTAYLEVIERDLAMLFWLGRLSSHLRFLAPRQIKEWTPELEPVTGGRALEVMQAPIAISRQFGDDACFTLAFYASPERPHLSVGTAVKPDARQSFRSAIAECMAVRANQYDRLQCGESLAPGHEFRDHVLRAATDAVLRDRALRLSATARNPDSRNNMPSNYRNLPYRVAWLNPPPQTNFGVVARVWIDGCQPMVPAGSPCGISRRWQSEWGVTPEEWEASRWHPYP